MKNDYSESTVAAMKAALKARDELISNLIEDIRDLKEELKSAKRILRSLGEMSLDGKVQ